MEIDDKMATPQVHGEDGHNWAGMIQPVFLSKPTFLIALLLTGLGNIAEADLEDSAENKEKSLSRMIGV